MLDGLLLLALLVDNSRHVSRRTKPFVFGMMMFKGKKNLSMNPSVKARMKRVVSEIICADREEGRSRGREEEGGRKHGLPG